jgi:hypothetical protein
LINFPLPDIIIDVVNKGFFVDHPIQESKRGVISMNNDHVQNNGHLPPSPEIMSELGAAVENLNHPKEAHHSQENDLDQLGPHVKQRIIAIFLFLYRE